jgi:hypothetical protein
MVIPHALPAPTDAPLRERPRGLWERVRAALGVRQKGQGSADTLVTSVAPQPVISSAAAEAALVRRITGAGSGPYSGTPFLVVPRPAGLAQPRAADEPSESARHDHGIIDHSRHVSSIGRR